VEDSLLRHAHHYLPITIRHCLALSVSELGTCKMASDKVHLSLINVIEFTAQTGVPDKFTRFVREVADNSMHNGSIIRLEGAMQTPRNV